MNRRLVSWLSPSDLPRTAILDRAALRRLRATGCRILSLARP